MWKSTMNVDIKKLPVTADNRGYIAEVLNSGFPETVENIHFCVSKPGAIRGNHYHKRKIEWMLVTCGTGKITLEDNTTKEKEEHTVSGEHPVLIKINPNITHAIVNCGTEPMHLFVMTNQKYNPQDTDTFR